MRETDPVVCLTGATATGKTDVGIEFARARGAEVVCCDALTVYRGVSILTAKPSPPPDVPHRLLDLVDPSESYSAGRFLDDADAAIREARARGRDALVVGGTALYLRTFLKGLGPRVGRDDALRGELETLHASEGAGALWRRLEARDPNRARDLHPNDVRRLIRALEIVEATGRPASEQRDEWTRPDRRAAVVIGIRRGDDDLSRRIDARTRAMLAAGVIDEVARLRDDPRGVSRELEQSIGFADAVERLLGEIDDATWIERVARATRRFTKRQATFLRGFDSIRWTDVGPEETPIDVAKRVAASAYA